MLVSFCETTGSSSSLPSLSEDGGTTRFAAVAARAINGSIVTPSVFVLLFFPTFSLSIFLYLLTFCYSSFLSHFLSWEHFRSGSKVQVFTFDTFVQRLALLTLATLVKSFPSSTLLWNKYDDGSVRFDLYCSDCSDLER